MDAQINDDQLLEAAAGVRAHAHAPFSGYYVGAAVLDDQGELHVGCNVENSSYPEGICAEANAIGSMVSTGGRRIVAIAIVGGVEASDGISNSRFADVSICTPCGGCRQRIREFADDSTRILMLDAVGGRQSCGIEDLLPNSFLSGE